MVTTYILISHTELTGNQYLNIFNKLWTAYNGSVILTPGPV